MKGILQHKQLLLYVAKFLGIFAVLFYGTEAVIGLSAPGNHYSPFVSQYLDFITPYRSFLLRSSVATLSFFDFRAAWREDLIFQPGGVRLRMAYDCIGYGVISFWVAFIGANKGSWQRKLRWIVGGAILLCAINIGRVSLLVVAFNKGWPIPLGWDHHTWFNIASYLVIFGLIYRFDSGIKRRAFQKSRHPHFPKMDKAKTNPKTILLKKEEGAQDPERAGNEAFSIDLNIEKKPNPFKTNPIS